MEDDVEASSGLAVSHEAIYQTIHALPRGELSCWPVFGRASRIADDGPGPTRSAARSAT
jgi:hypothetical protein